MRDFEVLMISDASRVRKVQKTEVIGPAVFQKKMKDTL